MIKQVLVFMSGDRYARKPVGLKRAMTKTPIQSDRVEAASEQPYEHVTVDTRRWLAICVGLLSLLLTCTTWQFLRSRELQVATTQFELDAEERIQAINREFGENLGIIYALTAFYLGSQNVERHEFRAFSIPLLSRNPSVKSLQWTPYVPEALRSEHEVKVRLELSNDYQMIELDPTGQRIPVSQREWYYPIVFAEPFGKSDPMLGFDWASDPIASETLNLSRDKGKPITSGKVSLQGKFFGQAGILVLGPIYRKGESTETVRERRAHIEGFVVGVLGIHDMVNQALSVLAPAGVDLYLVDGSTATPQFIHMHPSKTRVGPFVPLADPKASSLGRLHHARPLELANRRWTIYCFPTEEYMANHLTWTPLVTLASGLVATALLVIYLFSLVGQTRRVERLVSERTVEVEQRAAELAVVNEELQQANSELERFNRLAVGRELRVIELKQRINELSEAQGEAAPYDLSFTADEPEGGPRDAG